MTTRPDPFLKRDLIKLVFMGLSIFGAAVLFILNTPLSGPTLMGLLIAMLLAPGLKYMERLGLARTFTIAMLFVFLFGFITMAVFSISKILGQEWMSFYHKAPFLFEQSVNRLHEIESRWKAQYSILSSLQLSEAFNAWGLKTGDWFRSNGAILMGEIMTWFLLVPLISFFLLKDGQKIQKQFYELVPNRFFERSFLISSRVSNAITSYLRAKMIEAILVGSITAIGLGAVGCPYALVFGTIAGITNIIPYLGPLIGAAPIVALAVFDSGSEHLLIPILIVILIANIIDFLLIFPIVVGNLVQMHPLLLIGVVILGQEYYGLIGMLLSIPIAAAVKVVVQEIHHGIYDPIKTAPKRLGPLI